MPLLEAPQCLYATVKMVRIDNVTNEDLTFSTRSSADDYQSFTVSLDHVLFAPPTDSLEPAALEPGAIGPLYLSRGGWQVTGNRGGALYKAGDDNYVLFKYPICKPWRLLAYLRVTPTKITVKGVDLATTLPVVIDVLGADAAPAQDLDWTAAAPIVVRLSNAGAAANGGRDLVMVWPQQIIVEGASIKKPNSRAKVDVLDVANGDFVQRLKWSERGAPIDLRLSSTGFGLFKVTPAPIVQYASGFRVTYPEAILRECKHFEHVDDDDVRDFVQRATKRAKEDEAREQAAQHPSPA